MNGIVLSLSGMWRLRAAGETETIPCPIPGDNFSALQDAGRIPDPYWRENEAEVQWVAERDWIFSRAFDVPAALLRHRAVYLAFDSIDTVAEVFVNGRLAGRADNQFRRWRFEVRRLLREGANELEVRIASPVRAAREAHAALAPDFDPALVNGSSVPGIFALRKCPCSGGWDWGISLPSSGLHGDVSLVGADAALLDSAWCDTAFLRDGACRVDATVRLLPVPVFAKGANWIPCDARPRHETPERVRDLLRSAAAANMNLLRVWGGGHFESDFFYEECDRLGLLLWHDLMMACMRYPAHPAFLASLRAEIGDQVRRLRDHPSIALWCGDNECVGAIHWGAADQSPAARAARLAVYRRVERAAGGAVRRADPTRLFWPSSPSAGPGDYVYNDANSFRGDTHYWGVWLGGLHFDAFYGHRPRFCSEFGFQSFPSGATVRAFADPAAGDLNVFSPVMDAHQKNGSANATILGMFDRLFRMPRGFDETLYLSQVQQAEAIRTGVEWWRSLAPWCMGTLYWQLDDDWPVASWSSLEWGGRWKALHHAARRFYAPLAASAFAPGPDAPFAAHLVWDLPLAVEATGPSSSSCQ